MRDDNLARQIDRTRWLPGVSPLPAQDMQRLNWQAVSGKEVKDRYGLLAHYTTWTYIAIARQTGRLGGRAGCWLTPTPYAACIAPYDLGLPTPRDACILVDVDGLTLWGPGTAPPSPAYGTIWRGGAIEFYCPNPIPFSNVKKVIELAPCGDTH